MKKMIVKVKKGFFGLVMAAVFFVSAPGVSQLHVQAEGADEVEILKAELSENPETGLQKNMRTMMTDCIISVSCSEVGMQIDMSTGAVGTASVLGIKDIVIMKKVWYGWKTVATSVGDEVNDRTIMGVSLLYTNAEYDETYRITCIHYANVDGYTECENDTGAFVFTY